MCGHAVRPNNTIQGKSCDITTHKQTKTEWIPSHKEGKRNPTFEEKIYVNKLMLIMKEI